MPCSQILGLNEEMVPINGNCRTSVNEVSPEAKSNLQEWTREPFGTNPGPGGLVLDREKTGSRFLIFAFPEKKYFFW